MGLEWCVGHKTERLKQICKVKMQLKVAYLGKNDYICGANIIHLDLLEMCDFV